MADSTGKRERLIAAACDLFYRQGIAGTTLAHIAEAAQVPLGNVYYYFKTKDDIVAAVAEARTEEVRSATAALQRRHGSPKARLKALVAMLAESRHTIADHGCPLGTLCTELANQPGRSPDLTAPIMQTLLDWAEQQFHAMGRRDARELALELVIAYEGSAVLTNALGQPEVMAQQARRLEKWITALQV
ncbi:MULTISPECIES: TetR/AcrR family transcriptional regulator [unclassified Mycobacterium]|uniref:TetR/AcrR family transcriptional regulator n=1 Tax=unclassified Mycobacterium TaxID=2642494 RepID=UPI0006DC1A67|nr:MULTISPECIES: TetR/AcrR family transcriptional regulator [unclassified Mycobacterium]OBH85654.1 TetR family transcriptional regulator [Mycobacterium sp. E2989]